MSEANQADESAAEIAVDQNIFFSAAESVNRQRQFFNTNASKNLSFRIDALKKLERLLRENEAALHKAIAADFKKSSIENYLTELAPVYREITDSLKHIKKWAKHRRGKTSLVNMPAKSYLVPEPFGVCLIIGAWNFPYNISLLPVVSAIAAGNTVILKPSEIAANTASLMANLINSTFSPDFFRVIEGGVSETAALLECRFDKIFFTGSTAVGKLVYQAAAKNLTPVILELGGKSPAVFTRKCDLKIGVKRMVWAKFLNAGQICIAPDYVFIEKSRKEEFLQRTAAEIKANNYSFANSNYVQIINDKNMQRLIALLDKDKVFYGGEFDRETRYIEPTILVDVGFDDPIMQQEIFGPILPVIEYEDFDEVISYVKSKDRPLACYLFTAEPALKERFLHELSFGGGAVNDALMHFSNAAMPFGGVGASGMGVYHGEHGFNAFTHFKQILEKGTRFESSLKYPPYSEKKLNLVRKLI